MLTLRVQAILVASLLGACGVESGGKAVKDAASADQVPLTRCGADADLALLTAAESEPQLRRVPARDLLLLDGDADASLCDVMRAHPRRVTIVQFFSVTCFSCMDWIRGLSHELAASSWSASVQPLVVMTDAVSAVSLDKAIKLKDEIAPDAYWVHDYYGQLRRFFVPGDEPQPAGKAVDRPLLVVVDPEERGFYSEDASLDVAALGSLIQSVMAIDLDAAP